MESTSGGIDLYITAMQEDETVLTEKELVEKQIEDIKKVNQIIGDDNEPEYRIITLAGEEHPAAVSIYQDDAGEILSAKVRIPRGDFEYCITFRGYSSDLEKMAECFEKL